MGAGSNEWKETALSLGAVERLMKLLTAQNQHVVKRMLAMWSLANLAHGACACSLATSPPDLPS